MTESIKTLIQGVVRDAEASFDARDIEPALLRLRQYLASQGEARKASVDALISLAVPEPGTVALSQPGVVEILEFCMRELRWPEVYDAMAALDSPSHDWRVRRAAQRVLEVYEEDWPGGEIYETYRCEGG